MNLVPTRSQHSASLPLMLEKFIKTLNNSSVDRMLLTDLLKAFDCHSQIMKGVFELKQPFYSLRSRGNYFVCRNVKTVFSLSNV